MQSLGAFFRADTLTERVHSPDASFRSTSALSCDPNRQPPGIPQSTQGVSTLVADGEIDSPATYLSGKPVLTRLREKLPTVANKPKERPRSWFPLSRPSLRGIPTRSSSVRLPKDTSASSIGHSTISAPILTGTTNIIVAEVEGVCCRDIIDAGLTTPVERVKTKPDDGAAEGIGPTQMRQHSMRLLNLPNARGQRDRKTRSLVLEALPVVESDRKSEDTSRFSAFESRIARRRAETINLCRAKINKLTGNGHIRRKSINKDVNTSSNVTRPGNDDIIGKSGSSTIKTTAGLLTLNHSDHDLIPGSLTRSFVSAIDKLDSYSHQTPDKMNFIRSKSSIFNLKKKPKAADSSTQSSKDDPQPQSKLHGVQSTVSRGHDVNKLTPGLTVQEALNQTQPSQQQANLNFSNYDPEPMQFSVTANRYVPAPPISPYPRGVKALGMHGNTMEFARAPTSVTNLLEPQTHTPTVPEVTPLPESPNEDRLDYKEVQSVGEDDKAAQTNTAIKTDNSNIQAAPVSDEEDNVIHDAPIYSPSIGDLSQYARPTPEPAQSHGHSKPRSEVESPTHKQSEKSYLRRLGLRKSKSGLGLLGIFNRGQKHSAESDSPLQTRDSNQKVEGVRQVKKSRSMSLAGLLKRNESASAREPLLRENKEVSSQPTKPSPLRYETLMEENTALDTPDHLVVQRRSPPRGSVTSLDRAKRMGIIGMPEGSFEKSNKDE